MTVSPSNTQATAVELHNGNNNLAHSATITVTFTNPTATAAFIATQVGSHLNIVKSGNTVTVSVKSGNGHQGLFSVKITPSSGCGAAQTVYINVAQ